MDVRDRCSPSLRAAYVTMLTGGILSVVTMQLGVYFSDSFTVLESDWIFWTLFIAIGTVSSFAIALLSIVTPAITCAIFSSYMMVLPIDYYAGSSLKYIIINVIRRATVSDFNQAVINPPTQTKGTADSDSYGSDLSTVKPFTVLPPTTEFR